METRHRDFGCFAAPIAWFWRYNGVCNCFRLKSFVGDLSLSSMKKIYGAGSENSIAATHDKSENSHALAFSEYGTIKSMELVEDGTAGETAPNREASNWNSKNHLGATGTCLYCKVAAKVSIDLSRFL